MRLFKRIVSLCALNLIERVKSGKAFSKEELDLIYKFSNYHAKDIGVLEKKKDRVLLKTVFEHSNCDSIRIFYHQREDKSTDYSVKTQEISRHFTSKSDFRKKIINFTECESLT